MNHLSVRSLLAAMCTTVLCLGAGCLFANDDVSFPEVVPAEKNESQLNGFAETLLWADALGYNSDDAYLYRIHNDAYYHLFAFSDNGDVVQLHDASKWSVHPSQRHIVLYWVKSDDLFIKPSSSCFSSYKFVLYNRSTQQAVEVNLITPPLPMGAYTFRIVNIEPYARLVQLSDNTVWQISSQDSYFPYWQIGQRVLIGVNNQWRLASHPHILINVDLYKEPYSQGDFYGYPVGY